MLPATETGLTPFDRLTQTFVANDGQLLLNDADTEGADLISMQDIVQMKKAVLDAAVDNAAAQTVTVTVPELDAALTTKETMLRSSDPAAGEETAAGTQQNGHEQATGQDQGLCF